MGNVTKGKPKDQQDPEVIIKIVYLGTHAVVTSLTDNGLHILRVICDIEKVSCTQSIVQ
jgi:hypothetical protein